MNWETSKDGITKTTSERVFITGIYYDLPDEASMERRVQQVLYLKGLGIEHVFTPMFDFDSGPNAEFITACKDVDLKIAPMLAGTATWDSVSQLFSSMGAEHLVEIVQVADDVDYQNPDGSWVWPKPAIGAARAAAEAAFPLALTWVSGGYNGRTEHAAGLTDVYARQAYPMYGGNSGDPLEAIEFYYDSMWATNSQNQPLIATPQLFPGDRMPLAHEVTEMSMYPLLQKLEGIVWYTANATGWNLEDAHEDYEMVVKNICRLIKEYPQFWL